MRTSHKPRAKIGISCANCYRASIKSPASDLEALVDAYGAAAISALAYRIEKEITEHGDSIHNGFFNIELNSLPLPAIRKQHNPANRARSRKQRS